MTKTGKALKAAGGGGKVRDYYSPYEKKTVSAETTEIVKRAKGGWMAKAKDGQGRSLNKFVARGTTA